MSRGTCTCTAPAARGEDGSGRGREAGRFTLEDPRFQGGSVVLKASCGGRDYTTTAYVVPLAAITTIQDEGVRRLLGTQRHETVGFASFTLPVAAQPPTAPRVEVRIFEQDAEGQRTDLKGVSVAGTPFQVGVRAPGYVVRTVKVRGEDQTLLVPDPLKNTKPKDALAFDAILQDAYLPAGAGSYVIEATALDPSELTSVTGQTVVQVLREPGGSTESVPGRPGVIAARTTPRDGARGVSVSVFPALDFTEPVKNVGPESVRLVPVGCAPPPAESTSTGSTCSDSGASEDAPGPPVPLRILALKAGSPPESVELTGTEAPSPSVVSLTLQPLVSLSFGTRYRLELTSAIADEDGELLVPYASRFSTFLPEEVGQSKETDPPTVTGLVILGERGYVLETLHAGGVAGPQQSSLVRVYDVTDPVEPRDLTDPATGSIPREVIAFPPRDIAGEELLADDGSPTGEKLIAVATAPRTFYQVQGSDPYWTELKSTPANLFLYDVSDPDAKPRFAGAANLTNNVVDGIPNRLFMQKGRIYAATFPKGIQVVDIENLRSGFPEDAEPSGLDLIDLNKRLFAGGQNPGAVVLTIPVKDPTNGLNMPLNDLEAMDLQVWGVPRKVVAATGSRPQAGLVLADAVSPYFEVGETAPKPLWLGPLAKDGSSLEWGGAIALTKIADIPHALVGGTGVIAGAGSQTLLAIVDLSPVGPGLVPTGEPKPSPKVVAIVPLPKLNGVGDILLIGNTAIVSGAQGTSIDGQAGGAALVDFTDPENPQLSGYVTGVGSRLAHGANNILYSSNRKFIKTEAGEPGVRNAALGEVLFVRLAGYNPFGVDNDYRSESELKASFGVIPADKEVKRAEVDLLRDGVKVENLPVVQVGSDWETTLQKGRVFNPDSEYHVQFVVNRGEPEEGKSAPKQLRPAWLEFGGTEEVADDTKLDLVKLFNPTPRVSLSPVADPGPGRRVKVRLNGEVRDSLGPISHVAIDGRAVPVAPRSGSEPFVGTFTTEIDVGPQETLVLVHAMNSLGNLASDQGILTPVRDTNGLVTGRSWTPRGDLSPQDEDPRDHEFRIELKDKGQRGETVQVALDTGLETRRLTLRRAGTIFRSDPLFLVPEGFQAAATLPQELKDRIVRGQLGLKSKVLYAQNVEEEAAAVGALILDANGRTPIDSVQPSDAAAVKQALALAVGMSGTAGPQLTVELASLREDLTPASPTSFVPFEQSITLVRQSADPKAGAFNLYLSTEPILPVYPAETVDRAGFREHGVVASAFVRLRGPTGENIEAVGVPAEKAQWVVEDVRPLFVEGEERPRFFDVVVVTRFRGHPRRGVYGCHGATEASVVHEGVQGRDSPAGGRGRTIDPGGGTRPRADRVCSSSVGAPVRGRCGTR